jgi:serine/threonine protein kinase
MGIKNFMIIDKHYYTVFDYMTEGTLKDYIDKFELSFEEIISIMCQLIKSYKEVMKVWFLVPEWKCKNFFKCK